MLKREARQPYIMTSTSKLPNTKIPTFWYPSIPPLHANIFSQEFAKPSPGLLKILAESGETPGYTPPTPTPPVVATPPVPAVVAEDTTKKRKLDTTADDTRQTKKSTVAAAKGKDWNGKPSEMDRLAQGLQKLQEDDLLQIVKIVNEHKTPEMYVKNDLDGNPPPTLELLVIL